MGNQMMSCIVVVTLAVSMLVGSLPALANELDLIFDPELPEFQAPSVGEVISIDIVVRASGDPVVLTGLDAIIGWDPSLLELVGFDDTNAGYDWMLQGFFWHICGVNDGVDEPPEGVPDNDGNAMFTAWPSVTSPPEVSSDGLIVTTLLFEVLGPAVPFTDVVYLAEFQGETHTCVTQVFGPGSGNDVTGDISSVSRVLSHKMHWPQLPDEDGWDVNATQPLVLADDWMCSETGWVKDVYFWGSWKDDLVGEIDHFVLSIHEDIPADQSPTGYSMPGATLWEREVSDFVATTIDPPTLEGWYDPYTGEVLYDNHASYFQYDVHLPEADWFWQDQDIIYWLNISAVLVQPTNAVWGWKSTEDNWNDDAVWAEWDTLNWVELFEPSVAITDDFSVEYDYAGFLAGGGSGYPGDPEGLWYFYENTGWMNEWFYDHPYDPERMKTIHIEFDVMSWDGATSGLLRLTANWSTPEWSLVGNPEPDPRVPPLPPLTPAEEDLYIMRGEPIVIDVVPTVTHYVIDYEIPDYNPEWVSIDVWGNNFVIPGGMGIITHDCRQSLDLAFVITGDPGEAQGACCYGAQNELCLVGTLADCDNVAGVYEGGGTMCGGMEACCLSDGTCVDADALCCVAELDGVPQGSGTQCTVPEACCQGDATCIMVDPLCCDEMGGIPQGVGTVCTQPEACCIQDGSGTCIMVDPLCCDELGGVPQGPGTVCTTREACCQGDGTCIMVDPLCCDEMGGMPQGPGTACTQPKACCVGDACLMVDPLCCDELGGVPQGPGTQCTAPEGCCLNDGTCLEVDPLCCDELGGTPQGAGTQCTNLEGCCFDNGTCLDVDPLCCDDLGGTAQGPGTACVDTTIACCLQDGSGDCVDTDPLCCDDIGGIESPIGASYCLGDLNGNDIDDACELPVARPDPWPFVEYGDTCMADSDCWGATETVAYCVPEEGGSYPGVCYAPTNRYISIARDPAQMANTARRISLSTGLAGPWWVGRPTYNVGENMYFASVLPTSVYAGIGAGDWVDGDWPDVIHVKGCEIAPGTHTYLVQAIALGSDESEESNYSEALDLRVSVRWGDVVSTCYYDHCLPPTGAFTEPSIDDVLAEVNAFQGTRNAPLPWMDIDPVYEDGEPEGLWTLIGDVLAVVNAFQGQSYSGWGPLGCP
jgi:hypothetical protein